MNIRRLLLDVDKALARPSLVELAAAIDAVDGVEALNIVVTEIDIETMDLNTMTFEGNGVYRITSPWADNSRHDNRQMALISVGMIFTFGQFGWQCLTYEIRFNGITVDQYNAERMRL